MRLCFSLSQIEDVSISPDISVSDARELIAKRKGIDANSIYIIYNGKVLRPEMLLRDCGLDDDALLHIVISHKVSSPTKLSTVDSSWRSSTMKYEEHTIPHCNEAEYDYEEPMIASVVLHVFGDIIQACQNQENVSAAFSNLQRAIKSNPSIVKEAISTPLFQDIISDLSIVRELILSNEIIIDVIDKNPGLLDYINDDSHLQDLVNTLSDTEKYPDLEHLREMMIHKIEQSLGNRLQLKSRTSPRPSSSEETTSESALPNPWEEPDQSNCQCREDHITLLCNIIAHRPDIVKAFMQRTPIYKQIAAHKPELLDELLKPERLRLMGKPEMIRALIRMDNSVQQFLAKKK